MSAPNIILRVHAVQRMFERDISIAEVEELVRSGETIELRPDDTPYPSRLVHRQIAGRHIHAVLADNVAGNEVFVVTVYLPDPARWDSTFRRRI